MNENGQAGDPRRRIAAALGECFELAESEHVTTLVAALAAHGLAIVEIGTTPDVDPHENALLWIRQLAGTHYLGGAFDPEHMRTLANIAADALAGTRELSDALAGTRELPDFEEAGRKAQEWAHEQADRLSGLFADEGEGRDE